MMAYPQAQHFGTPQQFPLQPQHSSFGPPSGSPYQQPPYPQQQQQHYQGYPPQAHFVPHQQQAYPPQSHFPPQNGYNHGPPPQQPGFGFQNVPQQYGPPAAPSPGYDLRAPIVSGGPGGERDAKALHNAMKGFGTNEKQLIEILTKPDPVQMRILVQEFDRLSNGQKSLLGRIESETSGYFREGLTALVRGPLHQDVYLLHKGIKGAGTKESFLNDVLCCRSNADIRAIKDVYNQTHGNKKHDIVSDVKGDLSGKTETLFEMILAANRAEDSAPYDPQAMERDAKELRRAMSSKLDKDQLAVCSILTSRSNPQILGISQEYQRQFSTSLLKTIQSAFSGHMKEALLLIVGRATDPAMTEAELLEESMKGFGTKDMLLVQRIVRTHRNRDAMDQVKKAYRLRFKKDLVNRVEGEVHGDVRRLLVACLHQ